MKHPIRIATWNTEGGRQRAKVDQQRDVLGSLNADVLVLTEPTRGLALDGYLRVDSPNRNQHDGSPDRWVSILGRNARTVRLPRATGGMSAALEVEAGDRQVIVYGSVLPWYTAPQQAKEAARPKEHYQEMFERVLHEHVEDITSLQDDHPSALVVWAGDFNQTLEGPKWGGSATSREALETALKGLRMSAWNRDASHASKGMCAIDLICGPSELSVTTGLPFGHNDDAPLSDHAGYVVEIA